MNRTSELLSKTGRTILVVCLAAISAAASARSDNAGGRSVGGSSSVSSTVWTVSGLHYAGNKAYAYSGRVEMIRGPVDYRFIRVIDFEPSVKVVDGRRLSWVWEGRASVGLDGAVDVSVELQKADFVKSWGDLVRTQEDAEPSPVVGRFVPGAGELSGTFSGPAFSATETWSAPVPGSSTPIFERRVTETPTHPVIPKAALAQFFKAFASFHELPEVQPYVDRPEFINPIHTVILDQTDFDFYQTNPDVLRVVGKIIDPISLQETRARADSYKWSLAGKAAFYDEDVAARSIDPDTGMLFEFVDNEGRGVPSHDSALWTGAYVFSQYLRYLMTQDPAAVDNVVRSVQGLLTLTEITGSREIFARTLRKARGNPEPPWYAGVSPFEGLEWKAKGNNDMYKGLMYGYTAAHALLCEQLSGYETLCRRIRDDVEKIIRYSPLAQDHSYNRLAALWLAAYISKDADTARQAAREWKRQAPQLASGGSTVYVYGTADWSGTHLSAVQYLLFNLLANLQPLPDVDAKLVLRTGIERIYRQFSGFRLGLWSVAFAKLGKADHPDAAEAARWSLRELPAPKLQLDIDHRIAASYVMSPFPSAPWKRDWTEPDRDRTQSLRSYPLFEATAYTVYDWKQSPLAYVDNNIGRDFPGADYLHAYWLGRLLGVFADDE